MKFIYSKKGLIVIAIILLAGVVVFFNRSYAHIYNTIGRANLKSPDLSGVYLISTNMATSSLVYVALGDSLTAGVGTDKYEDSYPYLLAKYMSSGGEEVILKDKAIPGIKSAGLLSELVPAAIKENPDVVTLFIGVNDIHDFVSTDDFKKNYDQTLARLTKETKARIYLINIPFIGADTLIQMPYDYYFEARTKEFNEVIKELAIKYNLKYVDLYAPTVDLFKKSGDHYSADLFHPSAAGYKLWAGIIYAAINQ